MGYKNDILIEMEQMSAVIASIGNDNVYSVPEEYFENFSNHILAEIRSEIFLPKNSISTFSVPQNYFENFADNLFAKIKLQQTGISENDVYDELETVAPFLNTINKQNVYSVPAHYFENFSPLTVSENSGSAKVISIQTSGRKWFKYAAAAVIAGVMATAGLLFVDKTKTSPGTSTADANAYAAISKINVSENISQLSDAELTSYLSQSANDEDDNDNDLIAPATGNDNSSIQDFIKTSTDDELKEYLKENKSPADKAIKGI